MYKRSIIVLVLAALFTLPSCQPQSAEEQEINALLKQAQEKLEQIKTIEVSALKEKRDQAKGLEKNIGTRFTELEKEAQSLLGRLANTNKAFRKSHFNQKEFQDKYEYSIQELQSLLKGFQDKSISKEAFDQYLADEKKVMKMLNFEVDRSISTIELVKTEYQKLIPRIQQLSDSLQ